MHSFSKIIFFNGCKKKSAGQPFAGEECLTSYSIVGFNMKTSLQTGQLNESVNILLIGNNPIEMSSMLDTIAKVPGRKIMTEIAFDVKSSWQRMVNFQPTFILIDDNIGRSELSQTVDSFVHNSKTRDVPITVLKNSNYEEAVVSADIMDYLLKKN